MLDGIEIINDYNTVLIDSTYSNLCLLQKGTATFTNSGFNAGVATVTVTVKATSVPTLAIRSSFPCTVGYRTRNGTSYTFLIYGSTPSIGQSCEYYVFATPDDLGDTGGLVRVYDKNEKIVFDSNYKYMRLTGFYQFTLTWGGAVEAVGRKWAVVPLAPGLRSLSRNENPTPPPFQYVVTDDYLGYKFTGKNITAERFITRIQSRSSSSMLPDWAQSYAQSTVGVMLVDVTNY